MAVDPKELLAEAALAIKDDKMLKDTFLKILYYGSSTQQVRLKKLKDELMKMDAPTEVIDVLKLLGDEKVSQEFFKAIG